MAPPPALPPDRFPAPPPRRRSVAFIEHDGSTWACFLVTRRDGSDRWHGHFAFRPEDAAGEEDEVRTADIFLEPTEDAIHRKARELGRPLLSGLLASALHTAGRNDDAPRLRRWFRSLLSENSLRLAADSPGAPVADGGSVDLETLHSLYASYRMDQVAHFIALVRPEDFEEAVASILDGRAVDFRARDRLQFAMMVVEFIESRLPLPPFEAWAEDYLANRDAYRLYAHTLHREGRLP